VSEPLVVATFNIRNGLAPDLMNLWPLRRRSTAAMISRLDADVLGLQEVYRWQLRYLLRPLDGYEAHGEGRSRRRRGEACPVLTRGSRLRAVEEQTRWFGEEPDRPGGRLPRASFPRLATMVGAVDRVGGGALHMVNTHLDERRPENRRASVAQLVTWLPAEGPVILLGDLNTSEDDDEVFSVLRGAGLRSVLPREAGGTAHGFRGGVDGPRIDHILVSAHWEVIEASVVTKSLRRRLPSDHWPVRAVLRLRG
jgi:endonuclease/exonuclease/phosphatase family metal-dependent hydrolase